MKIEVECRSEEEADEAIAAGADIVMLDNYEGEALKIAAGNIKQRWAAKGRQVLDECSGGVTEQTIEEYICDGKQSYYLTRLLQLSVRHRIEI